MDKFYFYMDPGHGWLEVHVSTIKALGIDEQISGYSYRKGDLAYLEEDCDAPIFMEAYQKAYGHRPHLIREFQEVTPIRSYPDYY